MDGQEYYNSLLGQGYSPEDALHYTEEHFPGFGQSMALEALNPPSQVSRFSQPEQEAYISGTTESNHYGTTSDYHTAVGSDILKVPWAGVAMIFLLLAMPFVSISFGGETESVSGYEILEEMAESSSESSGGEGDNSCEWAYDGECDEPTYCEYGTDTDDCEGSSSSDGDGLLDGIGEIPDEFLLAGIAILMLIFSPIIYLLSAIISIILLALKKSPVIVGVLHLSFFIIFMICSVLGTIDLGEFGSLSVHGDLTGWGFFLSGLAGIFLMIKA